ncbi:hypothetical protein ACKE5C_17975 [Aneurinibacillus thermoaerophilus]|uniref:hypothetical protein n=1 Tax=Aneurinibacillus thermoaerophilus TaxID=143495 RepID=UPI001FEAF06A|nr:hypothetical protein [Aneurinibacillus thermoaerophilus]
MFGSLKNIYDMYRLGKSVVNSKSFQKSLNRAEKEYQKRRKKQEEKLKRTKAGRRQLKEIKAYEKATKQLWKGFTQSFQTLGKVCTSARKLATNLLPIEQIYKLKKIMKAEVIKKQNSAIKKLQKPKPIQKPKSVSPSSPPKRSMMDDLVVGLKKFGREFKPAFSHGAKELVTLSNYKPLTRELVGKENFDALTDNKWTMDDVKAAGGALENLFLGRLKIVKNINKTVKITKRLDKAKQPLQPPKPKQSTGNATKGTGKFSKYDVGLYKEIKGVPGLDAHHVGQKAIMKKFIRNYDPNNAPAILVPKAGHTRKGPRGIVSRSSKGIESVRQLLARDIMELRRVYPDIPNSQLRKLIELNKQLYPEMRRR